MQLLLHQQLESRGLLMGMDMLAALITAKGVYSGRSRLGMCAGAGQL